MRFYPNIALFSDQLGKYLNCICINFIIRGFCLFASLLYAQVPVNHQGVFTYETFQTLSPWKSLKKLPGAERCFSHELKGSGKNHNIEIFLGTWCSDSRKWIPVFLKLAPILQADSLFFVFLDENKEDTEGLAKRRNISHVPTFILYRKQTEVGRIIESPESGVLSKDLLKIFQQP